MPFRALTASLTCTNCPGVHNLLEIEPFETAHAQNQKKVTHTMSTEPGVKTEKNRISIYSVHPAEWSNSTMNPRGCA